jgi:hypothetical protein
MRVRWHPRDTGWHGYMVVTKIGHLLFAACYDFELLEGANCDGTAA